jgi:hypothetical protein
MKGIKVTHERYWNHSMLSYYGTLFPLLLLYQCPGITIFKEKEHNSDRPLYSIAVQ